VMPSRYENYSNAVLEALACGVPFLGSDIGGNRRLMESKGGWLFASGSDDSLLQAIDALIKNPYLVRQRGASGAEMVRQTYSWQISARRLEDIFQSCLNTKVQVAWRP
jgi:L-malate glycosyltransferase